MQGSLALLQLHQSSQEHSKQDGAASHSTLHGVHTCTVQYIIPLVNRSWRYRHIHTPHKSNCPDPPAIHNEQMSISH